MNQFAAVPHALLDDERISRCDLLVYLALSRFANKERECFPSIRRLAAAARYSTASVQGALERLRRFGYIERQRRFVSGGRRAANLYHLPNVSATDTSKPLMCQPLIHDVSATDTLNVSATDTELESDITRTIELLPPTPAAAPAAEPSPPAPKRKKPEADPAVKELIRYFAEAFEDRTSTPPTIAWGRWGANLKAWLRLHDPDTIRAVIDRFFSYNGRTRFAWGAFANTFDNLVPHVMREPVRRDKI